MTRRQDESKGSNSDITETAFQEGR